MGKWELTMDPVQEWGEEVEQGIVYGVTLRREPVAPPTEGPEEQPALGFVQYRTCKLRRVKAATLECLVTHLLVPHSQESDYVQIFLSMYRAFTSPERIIDLLFQRADTGAEDNSSDYEPSLLLQLIQTWLEEYTDDFWEPPQHPSLQLLSAYLRPRLQFQSVAEYADKLLTKFLDEGRLLAEEENQQDAGLQDQAPECDDLGTFLDLPVLAIAQQLTRLDAELFVKVNLFHCLGCIWSQRDKKQNMCPTIRATIAQFNAITNRVITSLLCCPATTPPGSQCLPPGPVQRACVIEKWIRVAQECRQLKNFSSLRAILSALQSSAIYRLKKTWAAVSKESVANFDSLCEMFPDENCVLGSGKIITEDESKSEAQSSSPKSKRCLLSKQMITTGGSVPYLGTYLTVLTMLDTALPDTVEGGLINFEKRRKEFEILSEIRQLQASCGQYLLPNHPQIEVWLQGWKSLTDQESYELSLELEPPLDSCPDSPGTWSHRLKKLSSLLSLSEGSSQKNVADQISTSSQGSVSSEVEDCSPTSSPDEPQCLSSSCQNLPPLFQLAPSMLCDSSPLSGSSFSSQPDLSALAPQAPAMCSKASHTSQHKRSVSMVSLPVYNRQVDDSCIVRVSVESGNSGNLYKSILLTSQDKTAQVIQRALEKHNLESLCCQDFTLSQVLQQDKELVIPDKANVFYAMSTSANYDFVLRQRQCCKKKRPLGSSLSFRLLRGNHSAL